MLKKRIFFHLLFISRIKKIDIAGAVISFNFVRSLAKLFFANFAWRRILHYIIFKSA